jgi:hypothetical protein
METEALRDAKQRITCSCEEIYDRAKTCAGSVFDGGGWAIR